MLNARWLLLPILALTVFAYLPGLSGPFLFDDAAHIASNTQVHIPDLSPESLERAWHSSYARFPASRPLAQLSFGINHALNGLDTWSFKVTNLAIHLLVGLLIYALGRQLTRVMVRSARHGPARDTPWPALLAAALWLLHPINLTPVLYVVQRMTSLSVLFVVAGLWCHVAGRLRMAAGQRRGLWLALAGLPLAGIGILAKESAALYPLLVLVLEWTLLRDLRAPRRRLLLALVAGLPLLLGTIYLLTHLEMTSHAGRPFSLEERLLTESRVLWLYLRMLVVPDLATLGFYHDDFATSLSLTQPWTTLPALLSWLVLIPAAVLLARRWPVAGFAVLFFIAGHTLESTIFPLELVFEHRNYLAAIGPLFAAGWLLAGQSRPQARRYLGMIAVLLVLALGIATYLRAMDWSQEERLVLSEVRHHPDSPRANFRTGQLLMAQFGKGQNSQRIYQVARHHFERTRELDPANIDALFGLVVLDLYVDRTPPPQLLDDLVRQLRHGVVGPTKLAIGQFSFLVRWQMGRGTHKLAHEQVLRIFQAVVDNPLMNRQGRAAVLSATRAYHERVLNDPETALRHARETVQTWPYRWHYHYRLVQLLLHLGKYQEAQVALQAALQIPSAAHHPEQADELASVLRDLTDAKTDSNE